MKSSSDIKRVQTIVIGGGQAGLAVGHSLAKRGLSFLIVDASARVGDAWRNRWDSLVLFTPTPFSGLAGMPFPESTGNFPKKDQVADYLAEYAKRFRLPIQNGVRIERLWKKENGFALSAGTQRFEADNVVVAMADYQVPRTPEFAGDLAPGIVQMHSHAYRNPSQLQPGGVLIVGAGNSAADIAIEVARTHRTSMSGKESGSIPWPIEGFVARNLLFRFMRFVGHHVLSVKTPIGRKARPKMLHRTTPLVRVKPKDIVSAGIERVSRTVGVRDGLPLLSDGRTLDVQNVIWCTGYQHGFPWIDLPAFDDNGDPIHEGGIVHKLPGLYFVGLHFLYAMSSATLVGVGRDAERIAAAIARRPRQVPRQIRAFNPEMEKAAAAM